MPIEGILIPSLCAGASTALHLHPRRVRRSGRLLEAAIAEAGDAGYLGEKILGSGLLVRAPPRRGRLHLR